MCSISLLHLKALTIICLALKNRIAIRLAIFPNVRKGLNTALPRLILVKQTLKKDINRGKSMALILMKDCNGVGPWIFF
jgi:hypothetical protein